MSAWCFEHPWMTFFIGDGLRPEHLDLFPALQLQG
jgi:hypothetical protein